MNIIYYPEQSDWLNLTLRPQKEIKQLDALVEEIFVDVVKTGDEALKKYSAQFDKCLLASFEVSKDTIKASEYKLSKELKEAISIAKNNIETFHAAQKEIKHIVETTQGIQCWRESRAIEKVGIYIPAGSAPLFSTVLMLGIPASIAGCKEIVLCSPPDENGEIHPAILFAANMVGITKVLALGGIQSIAAMTFGTQTVPKVDKIFGPGNQYVTAAKQMAQRFGVAIDMPAGPSEVLIIADENCNPSFVAADLLSQAEHGEDSQVVLLSPNNEIISSIMQELEKQLAILPRTEIAKKALEHSKAILLKNIHKCIDFSNLYAPEHLILATKNYMDLVPKIINAGSVFLGNYSCESIGDYASGTNHTLPTNSYARMYSGVSLDSFVKKITFQEVSKEGLENIGKTIEFMANAEGLSAHKNAVSIRLNTIKND